MSFTGPINLPSPARGGNYYSKELLSSYLCLTSVQKIDEDVKKFGFYLANAKDSEHESSALEKFKDKIEAVLSEKVETRKNSLANSLNRNLNSGNDMGVASIFASLWRRNLGETSLDKAQKSAYGYGMNGNNRLKSSSKKERSVLCEWCSKQIVVPVGKGFTCPFCGVYFQNFEPQKAKIDLPQKDWAYEEKYDELTVIDRIRRGEWGLEKTNLKFAAQITMM